MNTKKLEKIKLIWDFRGINSDKIANHHLKHLTDFFKIEKEILIDSGVQNLNQFHSTAFVIIMNKDLEKIKSILKPHRGQKVE